MSRLGGLAKVPEPVTRSIYNDLLKLQHSDGYWKLDDTLCTLIGTSTSVIIAELEKAGVKSLGNSYIDIAKQEFATALAIAYLELYEDAKNNLWQAAAEKGRKWIKNSENLSYNLGYGPNWINYAKKFLQQLKQNEDELDMF